MATKDISDAQVIEAYTEMHRQMAANIPQCRKFEYADTILMRTTSQPHKVCYRAMERAHRRELVDYGMWLKGGWATRKGLDLIKANSPARADV